MNCDSNVLGKDDSSGVMGIHVASDNIDSMSMLQGDVLNVSKQHDVGSKVSVSIESENAIKNDNALGRGHRTKIPSTKLRGFVTNVVVHLKDPSTSNVTHPVPCSSSGK